MNRAVKEFLRRLGPVLVILLPPFSVWLGVILSHPQAPEHEESRLRVTIINVGQGEAALIRTPSGGTVLIGAGPPEAGSLVVDALRDAKAKRIDMLILPYPYAEAIGGVPELFEAFPIGVIMDPGGERINAHITNALSYARDYQTDWRTVRAGDVFSFRGDPTRIEILAPTNIDPHVRAPDNSLVVLVRYKDTRFLFAGGIGKKGERALLARTPRLESQWLRVARSGTDEASSLEFLRQVNPEWAVISVGPNGDGYPGAGALNRLRATGAILRRTDESGGHSLTFWSDGKTISEQ